MTVAEILARPFPDRRAVRHALTVERTRMHRYHVALAAATNARARGRCGRMLDASVSRAAKLAFALIDMGEAMPMTNVDSGFDDQLLDAMNVAMGRGRGARGRDMPRQSASGRAG